MWRCFFTFQYNSDRSFHRSSFTFVTALNHWIFSQCYDLQQSKKWTIAPESGDENKYCQRQKGESAGFSQKHFLNNIGSKWLTRYLPPRNLDLSCHCITPHQDTGLNNSFTVFSGITFTCACGLNCPAAARHLGDSPDKKHASGIKATLDRILSIHCSSGDCASYLASQRFCFLCPFLTF